MTILQKTYATLKWFINKPAPTLDGFFNEMAGKHPLIKDAIATVEVSKSVLHDDEVKKWFDAATPINSAFSDRVRYYLFKMERGGRVEEELLALTRVRCTYHLFPYSCTLSSIL